MRCPKQQRRSHERCPKQQRRSLECCPVEAASREKPGSVLLCGSALWEELGMLVHFSRAPLLCAAGKGKLTCLSR